MASDAELNAKMVEVLQQNFMFVAGLNERLDKLESATRDYALTIVAQGMILDFLIALELGRHGVPRAQAATNLAQNFHDHWADVGTRNPEFLQNQEAAIAVEKAVQTFERIAARYRQQPPGPAPSAASPEGPRPKS